MKRIFMLLLFIFSLFLPKNASAMEVDYVKSISIFGRDESLIGSCDINSSGAGVQTCRPTSPGWFHKVDVTFDEKAPIDSNLTLTLVFRLYIDKGVTAPPNFDNVYANVLGNRFDGNFVVTNNLIGTNIPDTPGTDFFTAEYQITIAPISVSSPNGSLDTTLSFTIPEAYGLPNTTGIEILVAKLSGEGVQPTPPDYSQDLDDIKGGIADTNDKLGNLNDSLKDDDVTGSKDTAEGFFNNFTTDDFGLSKIITFPLETIKSITSKTCTPLVLPLPFVNKDLTLPCIRTIFEERFNSILTIYQTVTFGLIAYYVIVRIFNLVKDFKNPEHDEIEVMDL